MPSARVNIEKRIEKEKQKIVDLRQQVERSEAFIQGLQEALQMLPKEKVEPQTKSSGYLRPGSDMQKIQELLKRTGHPLPIDEIIGKIGKQVSNATRASIASSLSRYVRKNEIFSRPGPNTFGLIEFASNEIPEMFGGDIVSPDDIPF
ncbi:hypothetical protein ABFB09_09355 [Dehalogenimonas sp. THU2]|uniref:hypothetical protein n=1 Tax=Dehalogenimonas sp. THU2 TaxID=3151121 RepID=UPI003218BF7B